MAHVVHDVDAEFVAFGEEELERGRVERVVAAGRDGVDEVVPPCGVLREGGGGVGGEVGREGVGGGGEEVGEPVPAGVEAEGDEGGPGRVCEGGGDEDGGGVEAVEARHAAAVVAGWEDGDGGGGGECLEAVWAASDD